MACYIHTLTTRAGRHSQQPQRLNHQPATKTVEPSIIIMPPKKAAKGKDKKKAPSKPKPKRQLHPGEVVKKHLGASHGDVQRVGDKVFKQMVVSGFQSKE
jgi:hypothetical protein